MRRLRIGPLRKKLEETVLITGNRDDDIYEKRDQKIVILPYNRAKRQ